MPLPYRRVRNNLLGKQRTVRVGFDQGGDRVVPVGVASVVGELQHLDGGMVLVRAHGGLRCGGGESQSTMTEASVPAGWRRPGCGNRGGAAPVGAAPGCPAMAVGAGPSRSSARRGPR